MGPQHSTEGGPISAPGGQNDNIGGNVVPEKVEAPKELVRESVKQMTTVSEMTILESSSSSSLYSNPATTSAAALDEGGGVSSSPPTAVDQDQQPPITTTTTTTIEQTNPQTGGQGGEKGGVVGKSSSDETAHGQVGGAGGGANGGKKKPGRGKGKMTLSLVEVTVDDVVKCILVTRNDMRINFQFSRKFDETKAIFKKLVSSFFFCAFSFES